MAQLTWYLKAASGNWDAINAWNDQSDGLGTDRTNPQNGGGNTYICDLNAKAVTINVAVSVDKIRTGLIDNLGGTIVIPNSTAAVITVATATVGLTSTYNTSMLTWGTGTSSLTVNGDVAYTSTSTAGMLPVGTDQTITINGKLTNTAAGYAVVPGGSGVLSVSNVGLTAISVSGASGRAVSNSSTGTNSVTGIVTSSASGSAWYNASGFTVTTITGNVTSSGTAGNVIYQASGTLTITGNVALTAGTITMAGGTMNFDGNISGSNGVIAVTEPGGTINWTGARTLDASADCFINMTGGTLNLVLQSGAYTPLILSNSGTFVIRKGTGTLNTTGNGGATVAEVINMTSTAYAGIIGGTDTQKAIIGRIIGGLPRGPVTLAQVTGASARGGSGTALKLTPTATTSYGYYYFYVPVDASDLMTLTFYHIDGTGWDGTAKVSIYDTDQTTALLASQTITDNDAWTLHTCTQVTATGTGFLLVRLEVKYGTGGWKCFDDFAVAIA